MDRYVPTIQSLIKYHWLALMVSSVLMIVPFYWFPRGAVDIGGDGGRLYFYDPVNLIINSALFYVFPFGVGMADARFYFLPFLSVLALLKQVIHSTYILSSLYSGMKIVVGFLAAYGIVKELLANKLKDKSNQIAVLASALLAGLFYIFNPAMTENYVRALSSHDQVFLNPLMFYLILKYITTSKFRFLCLGLFVSLLFSHSFSYTAAPPIFAFYPLGLLFLILHTIFVRQQKIPWKGMVLGLLLFLGLHAFHLLPEFFDLFSPGSNINTRVFDKADVLEQIGYFSGVLPIPKLSIRWFAHSVYSQIPWASFTIPLVVLLGLILIEKKEKTAALIGFFFLITFYFVNAKITNVGVEFYKSLFYIPGFSMFRNFYGQWQFVYYFFYSLFFGVTVVFLLNRLKHKYVIIFLFIIVLYFIVSSWQFINGQLINQLNTQSTTRIGIVMDPKFETILEYIHSLPNDGKILLLPSTDYDYQVVQGLNNGAFVGSSMIGQLTGKKDFAGYQHMAPYSDMFWKLSQERKYTEINRLFGLLNIQYIFYNSDPQIYDSTFPGFPYSPDYVRKFMPKNQAEYSEYIDKLSLNKIYEKGYYQVYSVDTQFVVPHIYVSNQIIPYNDNPTLSIYNKASSFIGETISSDIRTTYLDLGVCKSLFTDAACNGDKPIPQADKPVIQFQKINPVKYRVKVYNATEPYLLIFSESFHKNWKVSMDKNKQESATITGSYFDGQVQEIQSKNLYFDPQMINLAWNKYLVENSHLMANGYANAWYITPKDTFGAQNYELSIEFVGQRLFYWALLISGSFLVITIGLVVLTIKRKKF